MSTTYCSVPNATPSSTPETPEVGGSLPLTDDADIIWNSAFNVMRSLDVFNVEPLHIAMALLYDRIYNVDEALTRKPPILDIPLLWTAIERAGGQPSTVGKVLRQKCIQSRPVQIYDSDTTPQTMDINNLASDKTKAALLFAQSAMQDLEDMFLAPHHLILGIIRDEEIKDLFDELRIDTCVIEQMVRQLRSKRIQSRTTKPRFAILSQFAVDLTELAAKNKIGPIIGRDDEVRRLIVILSRFTKNNAILLGEPGVGKTAIAEALALRIVARDGIPKHLNARIFSLDMGSLIASTACHGKLELRVKAIMKEIQDNEEDGIRVILHIDDIHLTMTGRTTGGSGGMDAANLMKPLLARGKLRCFGATTLADYQRCMEADGSFTRRFTKIIVCESTVQETITILRGLCRRLQEYHGVEIMDGAIIEAAVLAHRYIRYRRLPDSAIDVLDEACSALRMNRELKPEDLERMEKKLQSLDIDIKSLQNDRGDKGSQILLRKANAEFQRVDKMLKDKSREYDRERSDRAAVIKQENRIRTLQKPLNDSRNNAKVRKARELTRESEKLQRLLDAKKKANGSRAMFPNNVTAGVIAHVVCEQTRIPIISGLSGEDIRDIEANLRSRIVGQRAAIRAISGAVNLLRSGLTTLSRPTASFMFTGPPGCGKSFVVEELADILFQSRDRLLRINGSDYSNELSLTRLTGNPACSGFDEGGILTECVKRRPFCIILIENIEKGCSGFLIKIQTVIDRGSLQDADGKTIDFSNCILVMTTSVGSHIIDSPKISEDTQQKIRLSISQKFPKELLDRLDDIILFDMLSRDDVDLILKRRLEVMKDKLKEKDIELSIEDTANHLLLHSAYPSSQGARALEQIIRVEIMDRLPLTEPNVSRGLVRACLTEVDGKLQMRTF